jgi:hypothetical protein
LRRCFDGQLKVFKRWRQKSGVKAIAFVLGIISILGIINGIITVM